LTKKKNRRKKTPAQPGDEIIPVARHFLRNVVQVKSIIEGIFSCLDTYWPTPQPARFQLHPPDKEIEDFVPVRKLSLNPPVDYKDRPTIATGALTSTPSKSSLGVPSSPSDRSMSDLQPGSEEENVYSYGEDYGEYGGGGVSAEDGGHNQSGEIPTADQVGHAFDGYGEVPTAPPM